MYGNRLMRLLETEAERSCLPQQVALPEPRASLAAFKGSYHQDWCRLQSRHPKLHPVSRHQVAREASSYSTLL